MKTIHDALTAIYSHAEEHMSPEELNDVADTLLQQAENTAENLSEIVSGLSCLVSEDGRHKTSAGSFRTAESVFTLLWGISQQFDHLAALIRVGDDARLESFARRTAAAVPEQPRKGGVKA